MTWGRASIIKAVLIRNFNFEKGEAYMTLNDNSNETAYILGAAIFCFGIDSNGC